MIERVLAGLVLAVCALLLLRLVIGERRRWRFDAALRRMGLRLRLGALRLQQGVSHLWHWRARRRAAEAAAADAIERARGAGSWDGTRDGNVYKPKSFRRPRKPH